MKGKSERREARASDARFMRVWVVVMGMSETGPVAVRYSAHGTERESESESEGSKRSSVPIGERDGAILFCERCGKRLAEGMAVVEGGQVLCQSACGGPGVRPPEARPMGCEGDDADVASELPDDADVASELPDDADVASELPDAIREEVEEAARDRLGGPVGSMAGSMRDSAGAQASSASPRTSLPVSSSASPPSPPVSASPSSASPPSASGSLSPTRKSRLLIDTTDGDGYDSSGDSDGDGDVAKPVIAEPDDVDSEASIWPGRSSAVAQMKHDVVPNLGSPSPKEHYIRLACRTGTAALPEWLAERVHGEGSKREGFTVYLEDGRLEGCRVVEMADIAGGRVEFDIVAKGNICL